MIHDILRLITMIGNIITSEIIDITMNMNTTINHNNIHAVSKTETSGGKIIIPR